MGVLSDSRKVAFGRTGGGGARGAEATSVARPGRDVVMVLPDLAAGGSQRVATILLNTWRREGVSATLVTVLNYPPDAHRLAEGIERVRLSDVQGQARLTSARTGSKPFVWLARRAGRYAARIFALAGLDLRALVARAACSLVGPERYLAAFHPYAAREIRDLRRCLRETRPRVVISFLGSTNVTAVLAARPLGLPVVISERNDPAIETLDDPWQYLRARCYRWADVVTANSRGVLRTMKVFVPESKLAYVPNPVRAHHGGPDPASRNPVILGVGRLVPQKAFDILLQAFAAGGRRLAGWSVEILGEGPLREELERLAEELGVRHRVVFHGYVDDPHAYYPRAGIFALPSRYEGMPNSLLEAMAAGLPVIVSDASPGPLEEVTDGTHGLVVPVDDAAALTAALTKLAGDAGMRGAMGEACRTRSAEHALEHTLSVWQEVVERAGDRRRL